MKKIAFKILWLVLLLGCSDPMTTIYNESTFETDIETIKPMLSQEDFELLLNYIERDPLGEIGQKEKNYATILTEAILEKEEIDEKQRKMNEHFSFVVRDKDYHYEWKIGYFLRIHLSFRNKSNKTIQRIGGLMKVHDKSGNLIKEVAIYDYFGSMTPIPPGKTLYWNHTFPGQLLDEDEGYSKIKNTDFKELQFTWDPTNLIFEDGTEIKIRDYPVMGMDDSGNLYIR